MKIQFCIGLIRTPMLLSYLECLIKVGVEFAADVDLKT